MFAGCARSEKSAQGQEPVAVVKLQETGEPIGVPFAPATDADRWAVYVVPAASCAVGVSVATYAPS